MQEYIYRHLSKAINALGLIFDIAGVLIVSKFGLPEAINKSGQQPLMAMKIDEEEKIKAKKYGTCSKFGILLIFIGFTLQFLSDFIEH